MFLKYDRSGFPEFALDGEKNLVYFVGSGLRGRTYLYSEDGLVRSTDQLVHELPQLRHEAWNCIVSPPSKKNSFARSEALRLLQAARAKGQAESIALTELGYPLVRNGNVDEASAALQQALVGDPLNVWAGIYLS
ncbi:MAG: hypothetical protein NVS1B11_35940 [Terriglobales bacterium]